MSGTPGEVILKGDPIPYNIEPDPSPVPPSRPWRRMVRVRNDGDRAIQVGSHFHFHEANSGFAERDTDSPPPEGNVGYLPKGLVVIDDEGQEVSEPEKVALTAGYRLDIPAGTAFRFEPGEEHDVRLVALTGEGTVPGLGTRGTLVSHVWRPAAGGPGEGGG
ncbi:hypothetical protein DP939_14545 [Spongiactinospora rosea]|uniref:Urease n=1 Tax=Spongiactinospora rosea TaxID=2248750 RepID=A0A366LZ05_9ACTN|nr:urease subunit beta [Spongiactinospora rosea]RBQ19165.1 hypothetical protein DP939_14545 [Spongiactinospora rosea]